MYDRADHELVVALATSSASLNRSSKKNWVENSGELPAYIRKLARAIEKSGKSLSSAIAIAISRVKKWAAGGDDVDPDTRAKAAKALAEWEALKAKNKSRKKVKLSVPGGSTVVALSAIGSFNTEVVNRAWNARQRAAEKVAYAERSAPDAPVSVPYSYIKELWTDFIIVSADDYESKDSPMTLKVPYEVRNGNDVIFGEPVEVKTTYVPVEDEEPLSKYEQALLHDLIGGSGLAKISNLAKTL